MTSLDQDLIKTFEDSHLTEIKSQIEYDLSSIKNQCKVMQKVIEKKTMSRQFNAFAANFNNKGKSRSREPHLQRS